MFKKIAIKDNRILDIHATVNKISLSKNKLIASDNWQRIAATLNIIIL